MGGHVRIGLEDNIFYDYKKKQLATNHDLVQRIKRIADEIYRPVASPLEARKMIGLDYPSSEGKHILKAKSKKKFTDERVGTLP